MHRRLQFSVQAMLTAFLIIGIAFGSIFSDSPPSAGLLLILLLSTPGILLVGLVYGERSTRTYCLVIFFPALVGFVLGFNNLVHAPHGDQFTAVVRGGLTNASRYLRYPAAVVWSAILFSSAGWIVYRWFDSSNTPEQ